MRAKQAASITVSKQQQRALAPYMRAANASLGDCVAMALDDFIATTASAHVQVRSRVFHGEIPAKRPEPAQIVFERLQTA